jgi:hypothetical protein
MAKDETTQESGENLYRQNGVPIHTGNAYEEDKRNNHYREPALPYNSISPNDNGVT